MTCAPSSAVPVSRSKEIVALAHQIAVGLSEAHEKGIVHRDLKPENVLVSKSGAAKIADFGLAKVSANDGDDLSQMLTTDREMTSQGVILGTLPYMSPEQARGERVDFRSDQFALGAIIYELLTGSRRSSARRRC